MHIRVDKFRYIGLTGLEANTKHRKWSTKTCTKISLASNYIWDKLEVSYKTTEQQRTGGENNLFSYRKSHLSGFGTFAQNFEMGIGIFKG